MSSDDNSKEFNRIRKHLGLSVQDVVMQMRNAVSFSTIYNFEHGLTCEQ